MSCGLARLFQRQRCSTGSSIQRRYFSSLADILRLVEQGKLKADDAEIMISQAGSESKSPDATLQSFANLDHTRARRTGFPEAVFCSGKTPEQIAAILDDMALHVNRSVVESDDDRGMADNAIIATRVESDQWTELSKIPLRNGTITYNETARIVLMKASALNPSQTKKNADCAIAKTKIVVVCAGTTDLPIAEEAAVTLEVTGCEVDRVYDVGVAGLHRVIKALPKLRDPSVGCVIVCAGMDGALPSVVGGLVSVPVLAVPTSIGYGASFAGVSALLTMLNSCAPGVGVVNIDNGFGAAALAFKMVHTHQCQ